MDGQSRSDLTRKISDPVELAFSSECKVPDLVELLSIGDFVEDCDDIILELVRTDCVMVQQLGCMECIGSNGGSTKSTNQSYGMVIAYLL